MVLKKVRTWLRGLATVEVVQIVVVRLVSGLMCVSGCFR
jgi:hypothetical protein